MRSILLALALVCSSAVAAPDACLAVAQEFPGIDSQEFAGCVCDKRLANLHAPLVRPLRVVAACLYWHRNRPIDLATEKVALDRFTNGDFPRGRIFVSGEARLTGVLTFDEMGGVSLVPNRPLMRSSINSELSSLSFGREDVLATLSVPLHLQRAPCLQAKVSVTVKGIRALFGDSHEAGAWPVRYKFGHASDFKPCEAR